jgi:AraC family transcriptional regulator
MRTYVAPLLLALFLSAGADTGEQAEVAVETMPADITVVGLEYTGPDPTGVADVWTGLFERIGEIPGAAMTDPGYGILLDIDEMSGQFTYMAGVQADLEGPPPEGMRELTLPAGEYAVFTFEFGMLMDVVDYIYQTWLPGSGYSYGPGYDYEYYPVDFDPSDEHSQMRIYVSVE